MRDVARKGRPSRPLARFHGAAPISQNPWRPTLDLDQILAHMTAVEACWICGHEGATLESGGAFADDLTPDDLRISDKRYGLTLPLQQCDACGFVYARSGSLPELTALYAQLDDVEYGASEEGRRRQMAHLLRWATRGLPEGARVLDVGAASGLLVREASAQGFRAVGVEPSRPLAARARADGLEVYDGVLPNAEVGEEFAFVALVDVIEHVDDPLALLRECARVLAPGGRLLVVTPDRRSVAAKLLGRRWWHRRLAHVGYFDRSTLTEALARTEFAPERWCRPRWYFPVGYLATRVSVYLPSRFRRAGADGGDDATTMTHLVVPLNLRDSLAVVARAA
jgi:SAM-dependent methyltransferase